MNTIIIKNFNELNAYSDKIPNELTWFENNKFEFVDNIPGIKMHIVGEHFDSSMSSTLMRSILKLQDSIYKQYSILKYGEIKKLSTEEKSMLEIYAKVSEGSSWIELIPKQIITSISEKIKEMNGKQVLTGIAIVSIITTIGLCTSKFINYKETIELKKIEAETMTGIQKQAAEASLEGFKAGVDFYKEIAKQANTTEIEINGEKVTPEEIKTITTAPRTKAIIRQEVIENDYKIIDIHIDDDSVSIDIIDKDFNFIKNVNVLEDMIGNDDYQMLKDSTDRKFMKMKILVNYKNDKIDIATLDSIKF